MFSQVTQFGSIYQLPPPVDALLWCKISDQDVNVTNALDNQTNNELDRLLPTLFECFAVVFCGFLAGRCNLISQSDIKGLNDFTTYFSLPPLIFLNLVTINFLNVNWYFVLGILVGKIAVFVLVALVTAVIHKPINLSYAGIYGIFCTQGNDMGLAYPIVSSLYGSRRPMYAGYMYLIAPTSLLFTNPMGFFLMETQKTRIEMASETKKRSFMSTVSRALSTVSWSVFKNPVVFVTLLGVLGNFLFHNGIPSLLYGILQILSSAFSGAILFLLGFSAVRCSDSKSSSKEGLLIPAVLIIAKMLVSPLITRAAVAMLCSGAPDVDDLADYGFMYGLVPTGPIVMLFAAEYSLRTEMMASTMVVCTALFAPMMFILARMLSLKVRGMEEFSEELRTTMFVISILSLLSVLWIGLCMAFGGKFKNHIHKITACLMVSQAILAVGILLWSTFQSEEAWIAFFEVAFMAAGQLMSRLWTTLLALTLVVMQRNPKSPFVIHTSWPMSFGFGIPAATVLMLVVLTSVGKCHPELHNTLPLLIYGSSEAVASCVVLSACLIITTVSLVLYYRALSVEPTNNGVKCIEFDESFKEAPVVHLDLAPTEKTTKSPIALTDSAELAVYKLRTSSVNGILQTDRPVENGYLERSAGNNYSNEIVVSQDLTKHPDTLYNGNHPTNGSRSSLSSLEIVSVTSGSQATFPSSNSCDEGFRKKHRYLRHVILLILCSISMAVGLTISTWKLSTNQPNGLFFAMEFLDAVLNVAQGVFLFIVFWRDSKYIVKPVAKWIRKVRKGFYSLDEENKDDTTAQLCHQFRTYHWENCFKELPKTIQTYDICFAQCFTGKELVDWLINVGLANHRTGAELHGQRLLQGQLLQSVNGAIQFHDSHAYFYRLADHQTSQ